MKEKLKDIDKEKLFNLICANTKETMEKLVFIKDWGKYVDRIKYGLSDTEYVNKMKVFNNDIMIMVISSIVSGAILEKMNLEDEHVSLLKEMINRIGELSKSLPAQKK